MTTQEMFHAKKRESAVDIVVNSVKELLLNGTLKAGDRLPNETELSAGLSVSRGSVREAMKILSALGIVDIKIGNGTYICKEPNDMLIDSLLFIFFVTNENLADLRELRCIVEIDVLELILKNYERNLEERWAMEENVRHLEELMTKDPTVQELKENEFEFHYLMSECCKNPLMSRIYNVVLRFIEASVSSTIPGQKGEFIYPNHRAIMDLINSRDSERITEVIRTHTDTWMNAVDREAQKNNSTDTSLLS